MCFRQARVPGRFRGVRCPRPTRFAITVRTDICGVMSLCRCLPSAGVPDQVVAVEPREVQVGDVEGVGLGLRQGVRQPRGVPDTGR